MCRVVFTMLALALAWAPGAIANPLITEFMASNATTLADADGTYPDWVEIHNPDAAPLNLAGWYLTDSAKKKTKWQFPAVTVAPGGYLVVFASGKDRRDPAAELHTNFSLDADGEYLALVKPDGATIVSDYGPTFPPQVADIAYGVTQSTTDELPQIGYLSPATPGARNGDSSSLVLPQRVRFSQASGPFTGSFELTLSGATSGQKIRYEIAGPSAAGATAPAPTAASPEFTEPLVISASTVIRAAVFADDGSRHGLTTSAHYVPLTAEGGQPLDTFTSAMPILLLDSHGTGALAKDNLDHPARAYLFTPQGAAPASLATAPELSSAATMTVRGSSSADFPKKSFNLTFQNDLGRDSLLAPLGLDTSADWALIGPWNFDRAYIRNAYVYALSNTLGRWAPRTRFVELFQNNDSAGLDGADYAGISVLTDRIKVGKDRVAIASLSPSDTAAPEITGGYVIKIDPPDDTHYSFITANSFPVHGSAVVIDSPKLDKLPQVQRDYIRGYIQDMESTLYREHGEGWPTRNYRNYIDLPSWIDHHILQLLVGNTDALQRSDYFTKDRGGKLVSGPAWDFDRTMGSADGRDEHWDTWNTNGGEVDVWDYGWFGAVMHDPESMQAWIDRWQKLRRTELATEKLTALGSDLAAQISPEAAARDAARWPDNASRYEGGFVGEVTHLKTWIANRAAWIDRQFLGAPALQTDGLAFILTPPPGAQIAYTLDGSDPRLVGGALAPGAIVSSTAIVLPTTAAFTARSYNPAITAYPGSPWSSLRTPADAVQMPDGVAIEYSRIINLSSRSIVGAGENALIAGLAVTDAPRKSFLVRAVGPALRSYGVQDAIADPLLQVLGSDGKEIARNTNWESNPNAAQLPRLAASVGAFPLAAGSKDAALVVTLDAGNYSLKMSSLSAQMGVGLIEVYELDPAGRAASLSARGRVSAGEGVQISGVVIGGNVPKRVLIRGVGPALATFGVTTALADPVLSLFNDSGDVIEFNDDWSTANATEIAAAAAFVGDFPLPAGSKDSALLVVLAPGRYSIQLAAKSAASSGVALLEVYTLP